MGQDLISKEHIFEESREWLNKLERASGLFRNAPSLAPEQQAPYTFENGEPYTEPGKPAAAFIRDRGFDSPA